MTSRDFCFWLQGFFEIAGTSEITPLQSVKIQQHLNLVFKHEIDPSMGDQEHQNELNQIHNKFTFPKTEEEAIAMWGPKPGPQYTFNMHGWYDPKVSIPRC